MRNISRILILGAVIIWVSCDNNKDCCSLLTDESLVGEYLVYEFGYSPGDRYIIESVHAKPPQIFSFAADGSFSSNYPGLGGFKHYVILEGNDAEKILALYEEVPNDKDKIDIMNLKHSYRIDLEPPLLKLYFRYCKEKCHIGLRQLE